MRVGGAYRLTILQPSGEEYVAKGVYKEITPPAKLSYTWTWEEDTPAQEHETLLTIEFIACRSRNASATTQHDRCNNERAGADARRESRSRPAADAPLTGQFTRALHG